MRPVGGVSAIMWAGPMANWSELPFLFSGVSLAFPAALYKLVQQVFKKLFSYSSDRIALSTSALC